MKPAQTFRRTRLLAALVVCAFVGLGARLVQLQIFEHAGLTARARGNTATAWVRMPRRGDIRDIKGSVMAVSVPVKTVAANPSLLGPRQEEMARLLAPLLHTNEAYLVERLQNRVVRHATNGTPIYDQHVVLKHKVPVEEWDTIEKTLAEYRFGLPNRKLRSWEQTLLKTLRERVIFSEDDQIRTYPNQALAAHILGYMGMSDDGTKMIGKDGIELLLEARLHGVAGWRQTERDTRGREIVALRQHDVDPENGHNVILTIDTAIQYIVETELAEAWRKHTPVSVSAIVVRPRTGEILAMATQPNFDPNQPGAVPADRWRNRLIMDTAEPGSTFKIVVVSGALNERVVTLQDRFDCENGTFVYAGTPLRDHEKYGVLSVENIIAKSSNIGAAKIGIRMGEPLVLQYMRAFGFGERTSIPLPGESCGTVYPLKEWSKLSISRIPMGHEVAVTQLQMVMAMCAIANGGMLMRPLLVDRIEDPHGRLAFKYEPQTVRQVIKPEAARLMVEALKGVVSTNGTAVKARMESYTVAGKTGTAQKAGNGGYLAGKYYSSFIGFFPADNPELCISVVLDEPKQGYYGGQAAAPAFQAIAERTANYLNIPPEVAREPRKPEIAAVSMPGHRLILAQENHTH